jgi:hypothetical protein
MQKSYPEETISKTVSPIRHAAFTHTLQSPIISSEPRSSESFSTYNIAYSQ